MQINTLTILQVATALIATIQLAAIPALAEIERETYGQIEVAETTAHTLFVNTFNDRALLIDADAGEMLGMLSLGIGANALEIDRDAGQVHVAENYYSRHVRGERTDLVSTYSIKTLSPISEIVIPPKHASGSPMRNYSGILTGSNNTRLMLVTNITPAVSLSVVDLKQGKFLREISTAGCGLVYPTGDLSFLQLCGDGSIQKIELDDAGQEISRTRSERFFDFNDDPLMEKAVLTANGWVFNSFKGKVFRAAVADGKIIVKHLFDLDSSNEWQAGGMQPLAYHAKGDLLLALMHPAGENTHKDPGTEIWIYNLTEARRVHRLNLNEPATSIQISTDAAPLIYAASLFTDQLAIYDLQTAKQLRVIEDISGPTLLQNL